MYTIRLLSHVLAVLLPIAAAPVLAGSAHADHSSESRSAAQFLSGSVLGSDQSTVVGIDGASAEYRDGHTTGTEDHENATLDVTALSLLTIALPDVELAVGGLLALGAVNQEAWAGPSGDSWATTDTAGASLDLLPLLGPNAALSAVTLGFGAVGTRAEIDGATGALTRRTTIADLTLTLQSPLVADLTGDVNTVVGGLTTELNGLEPALTTTLDSSLTQVLTLLGTTGTVIPGPTVVDVDTSRLGAAVAAVLDRTLCTGLTCVNLTNGVITVDLAGGVDLNNLPPNTTLTGLLTQVSGDVATLLSQVQTELNQILTNALDRVDLTLHADATVTVPVVGTPLGGLDIDYSGSLGALMDGSADVSITGTGAVGTALAPLLDQATTLVQDAVMGTVDTELGTVVADAGAAVDALVNAVAAALGPVLTALAGIADITLNQQNVSDGMTSRATVTAVAVDVLTGPLAGVTLDLATSAVGPNAFAPVSPPIDPTDDPVPGGTDTPVDTAGPDVVTTSPTDGDSTNDTTPTVASPGDGVLPDTGSPFGAAVLVLLAMLGLALVAGGTALTRRHWG